MPHIVSKGLSNFAVQAQSRGQNRRSRTKVPAGTIANCENLPTGNPVFPAIYVANNRGNFADDGFDFIQPFEAMAF